MKPKKRSLAAVLPSNIHILGQPKPRDVTPQHDWHVLKEMPGATHQGGIEIPENKRVPEAEIIASGPGRVNAMGALEPMTGKPGQRVLFEGVAKPFVIDGKVIHCIRDVMIIGVVERAKAESGEEKAS